MRIRSAVTAVLCPLLCLSPVAGDDRPGGTRGQIEKMPAEKLERLAALWLKLGQNDDCRAALTKLLKDDPSSPAAHRLLARLEYRLGRYEESAKAAGVALATSPDDSDAAVIKAAALRALHRDDDAAKITGRLPLNDIVRREEALGLVTNRPALKPEDGSTASDNAPDAADVALDKARDALQKHRLKSADELTAAALKEWPHNKAAIELRADFLCEAGRPSEAVPLYRKLKSAHDPSSGPFPQLLDMAFALNDAGLKDEAHAAFTAVVADKHLPSGDRAKAAKVLAEERENQLLAQGNAALDSGNCAEAARICDELVKTNAASSDVQLLHAGVLAAKGRHAEAATIYEQIKKAIPAARRFDSQIDYAGALAASRNYKAAAAAYDEVALSPSLYTEEEMAGARQALDDLHGDHFPRLAAEFVSGAFDEGRIWRGSSAFASMRAGARRWLANIAWDRIELEQKLFPAEKTGDRLAATAGIEQQFGADWSGSVLIGGCNAGVMGSISAEYAKPDSLGATLRLAANDPARDTLLLEAMDGRQHSLGVDVSSPLGRHFAIDATLLARQIAIGGHDIGQAAGIESQFRWHPFTVKEDTWLAYALEVKGFSARADTFNREVREFFGTNESPLMPEVYDAVPRRINRHALLAHSTLPLTKKVAIALTGEVAYREEARKVEYSVIPELRWKIAPRAEAFARYEYDTGGAGPNTNGSVKLGTIGLKWTW
ncbi:MAG: tetratricopeptide repeat protein [Verrucomicrobiaceae bacterium]|nr:tetratricopeptide repeat protein [Verrucomicrobiaceae bacterium]